MTRNVPVWEARGTHPKRLYSPEELKVLKRLDEIYLQTRSKYYPIHKSKYAKTHKHDYPKDVGDVLVDARSGRLYYPYSQEIVNALKELRRGTRSYAIRRKLPAV